jgi:Tfp pilus assembly protein FimV
MRKFSRGLTPLVAALASPAALAINLGELHTLSALGSPLDAHVDIYAGPEEPSDRWQVEILSDSFASPLSAPAAWVSTLSGHLVKSADGSSYIHIESSAPVDYARLSFRLRLSTPTGALIGRYAITLDPPPPVLLAARPRVATARRQPPLRAATLVQGTETYGPVRPGESLWSIARKTAAGRNIDQVMREIHASNPSAFSHGNIDRLRTGVLLVLGPAPSVRVAQKTAPPPVVDSVPLNLTAIPTPTQPAIPVASPRKKTTRDPLLAARLAVLDEKFAAIRARYGPQATALTPASVAREQPATAPQPVVAVTASKAAPAQPAAALVAAPIAPLAPLAPVSAALKPPAAVAARQHPPTPSTAEAVAAPSVGGAGPYWLLGALAAAAAVGALAKTRRKAARPVAAGNAPSTESTLKAEVARKSGNRVRLENEIRALIEPTGALPDLTNLKSARPPEIQPMPSGVVIPEANAIDVSIAQGQYVRAESLLQTVIESAPRNVQAKLRLAEVYYITEQEEAFTTLALEVQQQHRAEVSDEDWQRLVRMGKIMAPEFSLFSGPKPVGLTA